MNHRKRNIIIFLTICFLTVIWFGFYTGKQHEQRNPDPASPKSSENDEEDRLIIISSDDEDTKQEEPSIFPADSVKKIVLELPCEEHTVQEDQDVPMLEADDFSITDSVNVICLNQPFDSSVTEEPEWSSSYTDEIYEGDLGYKVYCHEYEDFEIYTSNYHFDIKDRTFDEYFIWQITIKTPEYQTARGIAIGDRTEDVERAYGTGEKVFISKEDTGTLYSLDGMEICFETDEAGTVTAIRMYKTGDYEKTPYFFGGDQKRIPYKALLYADDSEEMQRELNLNISRVKIFEAGTLYRLYLSLPDAEVSWDGSCPEYLPLGYYYVTYHTVYCIFGPDAEGEEKDRKEEAMQRVRDGAYEQCMIVCDENGTEDTKDDYGRYRSVEADEERRIFHGYSDDAGGRDEYETIVWEKGKGISYYEWDRETEPKRVDPPAAVQEGETTVQDTWENAQRIYEEFVDGKRGACGMDMLDLATPTGEPNKRYATEYVILDSNGDGIPELHTRTGREFYVFTCKNGQMKILAGYFSRPYQYTLLTDGAFLYWEDRGYPHGNYYYKFRLDAEGEEIDKTRFWWSDTNENLVMDEDDEYVYDDTECTKEEWLSRTADDICVDDDGWEHVRNEVEWITWCEERRGTYYEADESWIEVRM